MGACSKEITFELISFLSYFFLVNLLYCFIVKILSFKFSIN